MTLLVALLGCGTKEVPEPPCPEDNALSGGYCDRDGNLVADVPQATSDPKSLIFSYTPVEDPAVYERVGPRT